VPILLLLASFPNGVVTPVASAQYFNDLLIILCTTSTYLFSFQSEFFDPLNCALGQCLLFDIAHPAGYLALFLARGM